MTATLPAAPEKSECVQGTDTPCTVSVEERTMTVNTGALEPETPVTVRLTFPKGALPEPPADPSVPNWVWWSLVTGAVGAGARVPVHRHHPGTSARVPGPVRAARRRVAAGRGPRAQRDRFRRRSAGPLYDLGERGVVRLDGNETAWRINLLVDPMTQQLSASDLAVLSALSLSSVGDSFLVSNTVTAGEKIGAAKSALRSSVRGESEAVPADLARRALVQGPGLVGRDRRARPGRHLLLQ